MAYAIAPVLITFADLQDDSLIANFLNVISHTIM